METVELVVRRNKTGNPFRLEFSVPPNDVYLRALEALISRQELHNNSNEYRITITPHVKGRTHNQQAMINKRIRKMAKELGYEEHELKQELKIRAVTRGWPVARGEAGEELHDEFGRPIPESEANVTISEASALIDAIEQFEAEMLEDSFA